MDRNIFPERLRMLRKEKSFSVAEVSAYLTEHVRPVSEKTIYGWETGVSIPNSEILLTLCEMYDISDIRSAFNENCGKPESEGSPMHFLTPPEWELVKKYRNNPSFKPVIRKIYDLER